MKTNIRIYDRGTGQLVFAADARSHMFAWSLFCMKLGYEADIRAYTWNTTPSFETSNNF